ncbi:sugar ABC transporter permease [candidate division KSB3 bacterium]|uniref:Sugar ABC transporter permease n=1 Tax=candidate division KSB3 bacterium TaxID=2044937 RepID=A0A2G6E163_9BACT|nr:MAG: sugar ABC transporter permease [candidate division KSB3 bacterium]PIE30349.1 MAG: sugar ABC transporter permease [candidate division KSB3 bacterium]
MKPFKTALLYSMLTVGGVIMVFPFVWMLLTSFKDYYEIIDTTSSFFPRKPTLANYKKVFQTAMFGRWFLNSCFVATLETTSVCFLSALTGYTLAKFHFPGRDLIFIIILSTLMIPTEMLVIPWYLMVTKIGLIDSYWGIWFPSVITGFGVFLMRQFMTGVPDDLIDAARIDGMNEFSIFLRVALPLVKSALAALGIFTFIGNWGAFLWPLIVIESAEMRTLPVGLAFFSGEAGTQWDMIMTGASIATVPVLVIFLIFQKHIIQGITLAGLKG